jgi:cytochrome P450
MTDAAAVCIVDAFEDVQALLRDETLVPLSMANAYRLIAQRLKVDLSASIRLLDVLPVFMHGDKHKAIRKQMATQMASKRSAQEQAARTFIEHLEQRVTPDQPAELISRWVHPLWRHMNGLDRDVDDDLFGFIVDAPQLFNMKSTLRARLKINAWIERFIALDEPTANDRLVELGQSVLGFTPLSATVAMSLHHVFAENLGKPLCDIPYPTLFPRSAVQTTDRYQPGTPQAADVVRCVIHSPHRPTEQNGAILYGVGEHVCLGRPLANAVWSMLTAKLASMPHRVLASSLAMERPEPVSREDYLHVVEPFQRPAKLWVTLSS